MSVRKDRPTVLPEHTLIARCPGACGVLVLPCRGMPPGDFTGGAAFPQTLTNQNFRAIIKHHPSAACVIAQASFKEEDSMSAKAIEELQRRTGEWPAVTDDWSVDSPESLAVEHRP